MNVFFYALDLIYYDSEDFSHFLSSNEHERSKLYRFKKEQESFSLRRGVLRILLGQYLKIDPKEVLIRTGAWGKPEIDGIHFNISHTQEKMILAFSWDDPLGVDLEKMDPTHWSEEAEKWLFSTQESSFASTMSTEKRIEYFFSVWTKKEAQLKGMGCGLSSNPIFLDTEASKSDWRYIPLPVPKPYIACLSTINKDCYVHNCNFRPST